jgi:hypothetical protein
MPTTVLTSIGSNSQTVTISTVSATTLTGFTNVYSVTLSSAPTSSAKVGDKLISGAYSYLITSLSGTSLTVAGNPPFGTTSATPTAGTATISRAFSSAQTWEDSIPANLVTSDQLWIGELYKEGAGTNNEWSPGATWLDASGHTTDATRYMWIRAATGQSFTDNSTKTTNALRYNTANGVAVTISGSYRSLFTATSGRVRFTGIQFRPTVSNPLNLFAVTAAGVPTFENCIFQCSTRLAGGSANFTNCLIYFTAGYLGNPNSMGLSILTNCTIVGYATTILMSREGRAYAGNILFRNCAVYNFSGWVEAGYDSLFSGRANWRKNFTNLSTLPGGTGTTSTVYANQFENTSTNTWDYRVKSGSNLIDGGSQEAATADLDIIGQTRKTTTPTVGAWEFVSLAPANTGNMFLMFNF